MLIFALALQATAQPFRSVVAWDSQVAPLLVDNFTTPRTAGKVHLTTADGRTPTQIRHVLFDSANQVSVTDGRVKFDGGQGEWGYPSIYYPSQVRVPGKTILAKIQTMSGYGPMLSFSFRNSGTSVGDCIGRTLSTGICIKENESSINVLGDTLSEKYYAISLRSNGSFSLVKNNKWNLVWVSASRGESIVYPRINNYSGTGTASAVLIPTQTIQIIPPASDSFNRASLGSTDGAGHPEANGGSGLAWQTGNHNTWSISGGKLVNSPTTGANLYANADLSSDEPPGTAWTRQTGWMISGGTLHKDTGSGNNAIQYVVSPNKWYLNQLTVVSSGFTGALEHWTPSKTLSTSGSVSVTGRPTTTDAGVWSGSAGFAVASLSIKALSAADLFCSVQTPSADVLLDVTINGTSLGASGTQAGVVLNLDNPSDPKNFVIIYFDGTGNIRLEKCVTTGGVTTYTSTGGINQTTTYVPGAVLRVVHDADIPEYRVFYNNALIGTSAFNDTEYKSNTYHGVFSTSGNAAFSNFTVWKRSGYDLDNLK